MTKINITLDDQNELNEILNEVSKKAKELQEAITRLKKLLKMMDWQDANRTLKVEEKAKLMKLPDNEFEDKLHQMALDFKNDGVIRV